MAKTTTPLELTLPPRAPGATAMRWLCSALRGEILAGRLRPGARLPSSRELARQYNLARGTLVSAFEQLAAEGYLESRVGAGTHVARCLPAALKPPGAAAPRTTPAPEAPARLATYGRRVTFNPGHEDRPTRAFRPNLQALEAFPAQLWSQLARKRLRHSTFSDLGGCAPLGDGPLREAIAGYLSSSRGVRCGPEQVMVVSGVQEALDLCARVLVDPGERVLVENPGYPAAARVFEAIGATVVPVGVDAAGLVIDPASTPAARLAYVTPAHQYPLGMTLSATRRLALLEWARCHAAWVFEDDYDSEFRYAGQPIPALQGLDGGERVLFAGSFNKSLFPALRLGYLVLPPALVDRFAAARTLSSRHPPLFEQRVLCDFLTLGHFARHLRKMRQLYGERHQALQTAARAELGGAFELNPIEAGLQTTGRLLTPRRATEVARAAAARQVEVVALSRFSPTALPFEGLQLGFAAVDEREIGRGVRELARVLAGPAHHIRSLNPEGGGPANPP